MTSRQIFDVGISGTGMTREDITAPPFSFNVERRTRCEEFGCPSEHSTHLTCGEAWATSTPGKQAGLLLNGRSKADVSEMLYQQTELSRDEIKSIYSDVSRFGDRLYREATRSETEALGKAIQYGIRNGWLVWDRQREEFTMQSGDQSDLTTLMWQVALTNWETTKKELSASQVATMARISLQALGNAAFPGAVNKYDPEQVNKALEKATTVIKELNARMSVERGRLLSDESK